MNSPVTCANAMDLYVAHLEGRLAAASFAQLETHLGACQTCGVAAEKLARMHSKIQSTVGAMRLSPGFDERATRRLNERQAAVAGGTTSTSALSAVALGLPPEEEEDEFAGAAPQGFLDLLAARFGAAPWWVISGSFHGLLILLLFLIGMAIMLVQDKDVVILTSLEKQKEKEPEKELEREIFKNPQPIEASEVVDPTPTVVMHEEVEVSDHFETDENMDSNDAFGDEGISDLPLGGSGFSGAIGVGGGGAGAFGRPTGGGRQRLARAMAGGGGKATESAVDKALEWLARNQEADGHWDTVKHQGAGGDTACTGLALLAFLGAGHTEKVGKYKDHVQRAVKWLIAQQGADGKILKAGETHGRTGYNHSIAGLALAESAGMARQPATIEAAQKAVDYSVDTMQQGDQSDKLGWRYEPKNLGDISVSGWFVMQLKSAKVVGLKVDPAAFEGADKFLDTVMTEGPKKEDPYSGHKYGYIKDGNGPNGIRIKSPHNNTAIGILCRQFLGYPREELEGGVKYFIQTGGNPRAEHPEFYYWYYGTLSTFQQGGDIWKPWNEGLKAALLPTQRQGGAEDGSWDPKGHSVEGAERVGGRVFTTAMGALCLEVYYRYLPIYK